MSVRVFAAAGVAVAVGGVLAALPARAQYAMFPADRDGCPAVSVPTDTGAPIFVGRELVGWAVPAQSANMFAPHPPHPVVPRATTEAPIVDPSTIDAERSLVIRHASVVNDPVRTAAGPTGVWTLGYHLKRLATASGADAEQLAWDWLSAWENASALPDGTAVAGDPWIAELRRVWGERGRLPSGRLDPDQAPFRLLAIVNRVDLADYTTAGNAGEGRLVYGTIDDSGLPPIMLILEYPLNGSPRAWARQWKDLDVYALGTEAFNAALAVITEAFSGTTRPRIRTNKMLNALGDWQFREFELSADGRRFVTAIVKDAPATALAHDTRLGDLITANAGPLSTGGFTLPTTAPFATGSIEAVYNRRWDPPQSGANPVVDRQLRHAFALMTCNGCHRHETAERFAPDSLHIRPRSAQNASTLSCFMHGTIVLDPGNEDRSRYFAELLRRRTVLASLLLPSIQPLRIIRPPGVVAPPARRPMVH